MGGVCANERPWRSDVVPSAAAGQRCLFRLASRHELRRMIAWRRYRLLEGIVSGLTLTQPWML
jgi:hypothetical protein